MSFRRATLPWLAVLSASLVILLIDVLFMRDFNAPKPGDQRVWLQGTHAAHQMYAVDIKPSKVLPPRFLSALVTYDPQQRFVKFIAGRTFFLSCRDALADTQTAIAKAIELAPAGSRTIGLCIPIRTYSDLDLIPPSEPRTVEPATDNTV